jgi:hypothetical protein
MQQTAVALAACAVQGDSTAAMRACMLLLLLLLPSQLHYQACKDTSCMQLLHCSVFKTVFTCNPRHARRGSRAVCWKVPLRRASMVSLFSRVS